MGKMVVNGVVIEESQDGKLYLYRRHDGDLICNRSLNALLSCKMISK